MRFLLVGNGPSTDIKDKARHAEAVVQINSCEHSQSIATDKTIAVFVANAGMEIRDRIMGGLLAKRQHIPNAKLILAKNPAFYRLKGWAATLKKSWMAPHYRLSSGWEKFSWPMQTVSLTTTLTLEYLLRSRGMMPSLMPSTGMIAYYSLLRSLRPGDSLDVTGFTFEGWEGHPWQIESQLVRGTYPPGYRDDPSYEKRPAW